jgi:phosphomannomutase
MQFGTSGLRGLVSEMTDAACGGYVAAFLRHLEATAPVREVLVGRDLRPSSPRIAAAAHAAISGAGALAVDCGVLPTPALALEAQRRGVPAVMVSGSHIPFDRNGLKFYRPDGEITKADEAGILAARGPAPFGSRPPEVDGGAAARRYVERYVPRFAPASLAGLRVGVHEHSAAGRDLTVEILQRLGADVVALGRTDDFVSIDTEAIAATEAARLAAWVVKHRLDALVSTDGDGDRPLIADETGRVLRGDAVGILTARALEADAVAVPLNVSTALEETGRFSRIARTRIGSPYVIEAVAALGRAGARCPVGFEANGGFLLGGEATSPHGRKLSPLLTRDAMLPMLTVLTASAQAGGLSHLAATLPRRGTASDRLPEVAPEESAALLAAFAASPDALLTGLDTGSVEETNRLDGVRVRCARGDILHLRASGNAPELRCYAEGASPDRAADLVAALLARAEAWLARHGGAAG